MFVYGAIFGDIIGFPYEFDRGRKTTDFALAYAKRFCLKLCARYFMRLAWRGRSEPIALSRKLLDDRERARIFTLFREY